MRVHKSHVAITLGCLVALAAIVWMFTREDTPEAAAILQRKIENGKPGDEFMLSSIMQGDWVAVFMFGPHTTGDQIKKFLHFEWKDADGTDLANTDDHVALVFVQFGNGRGRMADAIWQRMPRGKIDALCDEIGKHGLPRELAKIRIDSDGKPKWDLPAPPPPPPPPAKFLGIPLPRKATSAPTPR